MKRNLPQLHIDHRLSVEGPEFSNDLSSPRGIELLPMNALRGSIVEWPGKRMPIGARQDITDVEISTIAYSLSSSHHWLDVGRDGGMVFT